jgi:hypothetical protein
LHQQVLSAPQVLPVLGFAPAKIPCACDFERLTILSVLSVSFEKFFFMALIDLCLIFIELPCLTIQSCSTKPPYGNQINPSVGIHG